MAYTHLEDIVEITKEKDIHNFLCPHCDSKLNASCFGPNTEDHKLLCYKCKIVWKIQIHELLYKVKPIPKKWAKTFF